jgi:hypothetical protein
LTGHAFANIIFIDINILGRIIRIA